MFCPACDSWVDGIHVEGGRWRCPECEGPVYESKERMIEVQHGAARFDKRFGYGPWADENQGQEAQ